jgi:heme/copper-type cytochrome/quinol oxidase subunit 1
MRTYLITSGSIFGLIVLAHLLRIIAEGAHLMRDPGYVFMTFAAAALCVWAFRLLRVSARS